MAYVATRRGMEPAIDKIGNVLPLPIKKVLHKVLLLLQTLFAGLASMSPATGITCNMGDMIVKLRCHVKAWLG